MLGRLVEQARRVGLRKIVIFAIAAAIAVALAYGDNSSNDAAAGSTLPSSFHAATLKTTALPAGAQRR